MQLPLRTIPLHPLYSELFLAICATNAIKFTKHCGVVTAVTGMMLIE
jgi:hypothetical protein